MGELVRLAPRVERSVESPENPALPEHCEGVLHVFDTMQGACRCGEYGEGVWGMLVDSEEAVGIHEVA